MATTIYTPAMLKGAGTREVPEIPVGSSFTNTYSFEFDGVDEYIQISSTSDVIMDFRSAWSVSWWAKWDYTPSFDAFWQFGRTTGTSGQLAYVVGWLHSTKVGWSHSSAAASTIRYNLGGTLNDGNWHHLVLTGTGASNNGNLYIDGSLNTDTGNSTGAAAATGTMNNIGRGFSTTGRFFDGNIDEISLWDSTLSSGDVSTLYNSGLPNDLETAISSTPVAWWRMGDGASWDGSDWVITDQGSSGNDGTSNNMEEADRKSDVPS